jgi:polysaccharide export outer membrane protein
MMFRTVLATVLLACALGACSSVAVPLPQLPPMSSDVPEVAPAYLLQPGDVLQTVYPADIERNEQVVVGPDGRIDVAYAHDVLAGGHSLSQVTQDVVTKAGITDPGFTISLRSSVGVRVYVIGEVTNPGEIVVDGGITALQAVSRAGGMKYTTTQMKQVVLIRRSETGRPILYAMDLHAALDGSNPSADPLLRPYDIVYVPRDRIGNVSLVFERIRQAIPYSFGFSYTGNGTVGY